MCWPNGEDNISYGPRTAVGAGIYGVGVAPKVGYPNGSDGVAPLCHAFLGGVFRLPPLSAEFSMHLARYAANG